jgi:protein O-GlcNAc transferase
MQIKYNYTQPVKVDDYRLAFIKHQEKNFAEAKVLYLKAVQQQPKRAEIWVNLASVCDKLCEYEEALHYIDKALQLDPQVKEGTFNKIIILQHLRRYKEAIDILQTVIPLFPQDADNYYQLGQCYHALYDYHQALACYKKASDLRPEVASTYEAARCYMRTNHISLAIICFEACLKISPEDRATQFHLLYCYKMIADYEKLNALLQEISLLQNLTLDEQLQLLFAKQELALWHPHDAAKQLAEKISNDVSTAMQVGIDTFSTMIIPIPLAVRLELAKMDALQVEKKFPQEKPLFQAEKRTETKRRLRIGYLSMDFRKHATAYLIRELFPLHDKENFEIFIYSYGFNDNSEIRHSIEQSAEHFIDLEQDSITTAAARIAADEIDILIDLAGFTKGNRFAILAQRPAPIQVNYLGYNLSTGSHSVDYFLADTTIVKSEEEQYCSEKIVYLPHTFISVNHKEKVSLELAKNKNDWQLPDNAFVFGCFNAIYKLEPTIFSVWMEVLTAVPNSVLWLLSANDIVINNLRQEAEKSSIAANRLIFCAREDREPHLARHLHMDLFLDTLQVNAITTACDALYMGVPVLTLAGDYPLSRAGKSVVAAAGAKALMQQFIASDLEDYKQKAIYFGKNTDKFTELKMLFQQQLPTSPLLDMPAKAKALETAYTKMWMRYQQGLVPQSFAV